MNRLFFFFLLLLTGCTSFNIEKINPNEELGVGHEELEGKLFRVYCSGNSELYASYTSVKNSCLEKTAKFIYKQGYEYFTMLVHDEDT